MLIWLKQLLSKLKNGNIVTLALRSTMYRPTPTDFLLDTPLFCCLVLASMLSY